MSKYDLASSSINISDIDREHIFINDKKVKNIEKDMEKQLDVVRSSLLNINSLLNRCVNLKIVKGSRIDVYKGWARKAKTQRHSAEKAKVSLSEQYSADLINYPIKLLDERINELEKKIADLMKN